MGRVAGAGMNIHDYLIPSLELDWSSLLQEWKWLVPPEFRVWMFTRSGDLFLTLPDGSISWLEVGGGELCRVANSRDDFCNKADEPGIAENWFMIPIVDQLVEMGEILKPNQCYSYRLLPIIGGSYGVENRVALPVREHFGFCGEVHRQIADVPDGGKVSIEIKGEA